MTKGQKAMMAALLPGSTVFLGNSEGVSQPMVAKARQVLQWCDEATITAEGKRRNGRWERGAIHEFVNSGSER